jgi:hypothetical protein
MVLFCCCLWWWFRALTGHSFLSRLGLACEPITDQGLGALTYLTRLTELTLLDGTHLSAERLVSVASRLPRLQVSRVVLGVLLGGFGLRDMCAAVAD